MRDKQASQAVSRIQRKNALRSSPSIVFSSAWGSPLQLTLALFVGTRSGSCRGSLQAAGIRLTAPLGQRLPLKGALLSNLATQYLHPVRVGAFESVAGSGGAGVGAQPTGGGSAGKADKSDLPSE